MFVPSCSCDGAHLENTIKKGQNLGGGVRWGSGSASSLRRKGLMRLLLFDLG